MNQEPTITPKDRAIIGSIIQSLSTYCAVRPQLIIKSLIGVLWEESDANFLLKDAKMLEPLHEEVFQQRLRESKERVAKSLGIDVSQL